MADVVDFCNCHSRNKVWKRMPDGKMGSYCNNCKKFEFIGDDPQFQDKKKNLSKR